MTIPTLDKKALSERDICTKFITPAPVSAQWDLMSQIREEVSFTKGRVIVRGQLAEFEPERKWWAKRKTTEQAWRVPVADIVARGYNLDVKNPHEADEAHRDPVELLAECQKAQSAVTEVRERLRKELEKALLRP